MVENSRNLSAYYIIEVLLVLRNVHIISRNQNKIVFYIHNYIDYD